jgi:hypothetical protein
MEAGLSDLIWSLEERIDLLDRRSGQRRKVRRNPMFDRQDHALARCLRRFPAWYATLRQPSRGLVAGLVISVGMLIVWLEIRDGLQFIGLLK